MADYLRLRNALGLTRGVIVNPSTYGTDNACMLDAMSTLGDTVRGIAVVDPSVSKVELDRMNKLGVRGIRFNLVRTGAAITEAIEPLAQRVADLNWHVQLHMSGEDINHNAGRLSRLPVPIVFDHLGRIPQPQGMRHPAFGILLRLIERGKAWVKISGSYLESRVGHPRYDDVAQLARAFIHKAPERVVWGSDWPHPSRPPSAILDEAQLFDLSAEWAGSEAIWRKIMVHNPETLYGFKKIGQDVPATLSGALAPP